MIIYRLECLTEDGEIEVNGYYLNKESAEISKHEFDGYRMNEEYGIKQYIIEIEVIDITKK